MSKSLERKTSTCLLTFVWCSLHDIVTEMQPKIGEVIIDKPGKGQFGLIRSRKGFG